MTINAMKQALEKIYGVDVTPKVSALYSDGHPGCHKAIHDAFPQVSRHQCLQHAKENIAKNGRK